MNTIIFLSLLFVPEESLAQTAVLSVDSNDKTVVFVEDRLVEAESASSIPSQPNENPIILEKQDDISLQEGIEDAFSKDHGDKFQPKNKG